MSAGPRHRPPAHPDSTPEYTEGREEGTHPCRPCKLVSLQILKQTWEPTHTTTTNQLAFKY